MTLHSHHGKVTGTYKHQLSPAMIHALEVTGMDDIMAGGPTRAALMRRGLVYGGDPRGRFGYFTDKGREIAADLQASKDAEREREEHRG